ncbi:MAG: hypothetical protein ABSF29_12430 [Tepidisphaeraceae bacterium]
MDKNQQPMLFPMIPDGGWDKPRQAPAKEPPSGSIAGRVFLALIALGLFAAMGYLLGLIIKLMDLPMPRLPFGSN